MSPSPIVFISYSHDSDEHRERVLGLSERLRQDGFVTRLDQYVNGSPKGGWPRWMLDRLDEARSVLCMCTETYYRRFRGHEVPGKGKGVDWEGAIIMQEMYDERHATLKFVPVLFSPDDEPFIPESLRGGTNYVLDSEENYDALCDFLDGVAGVEPGPVGTRKARQRRRGTPLDFASLAASSKAGLESTSGKHNLPFDSIGQLFKGRDELIEELGRSLRSEEQAAAITAKRAVHGLGGVGKSRLAVEYAWRNQTTYWALLFVTASSPAALQAGIAELSRVLKLPGQDLPETEQIQAVLNHLREQPGWLLILDNVDEPDAVDAVEQLLPGLEGGHVLITSRQSQWSGAVRALPLDVLEIDDAVDFLRERVGRDDEEFRELAETLGGLAAALEQAASYIRRARCTVAEYLRRWRANEPAVLKWHNERLMQYHSSVAVTWQTTLDQIEHTAARETLELLSWLDAAPIPRQLMADYEDALIELADWSMLTLSPDSITIHRVVQQITRARIPAEQQRPALEAVLAIVIAAAPDNPHDVRTWPVWDTLRPHVSRLIEHAEQYDIIEPSTRLMNELGILLKTKCVFDEAEPLVRRALAIDEQSYGAEHPNVAIRLNNLAQLLQDTNRLAEAEPLMRRMCVIICHFGRVTGHNHPHMGTALQNYRILLGEMELDPAEVEQRMVSVLKETVDLQPLSPKLRQLLGPTPPIEEVLAALDQQYRDEGKPAVWFLPLSEPIAPHLETLLGPTEK